MATNRIETLDPALIRPGMASRMVFRKVLLFPPFTCFVKVSKETTQVYKLSCEEFLFFVLLPTGRIDRKIEFPLPDEKTKRRIFTIHTGRMTLAEDVNLEEYVMAKDDLSGADIKVQYEKKKEF